MFPASPSVLCPSCFICPFSLQSPPPPSSPQPEVQVCPPSAPPPPHLVTEDESPGQRTVEVAIPNVGTFLIESEEGGYDDEVALAQTHPPLPFLC